MGEKTYREIKVARLLGGGQLVVPLHEISGSGNGPKVLMLAVVHGDEPLPIPAFRELVGEIEPGAMKGMLRIIPVANPVAFGQFERMTRERHDINNLWRAFPGSENGTMTQMMAATIVREAMEDADYVVEYHSGGAGGRIQRRVDFDTETPPDLMRTCRRMAFAYGAGIIHQVRIPEGSPVKYALSKGKPAISVEIGGAYLGEAQNEPFVALIRDGAKTLLGELGLLQVERKPEEKQLFFTQKERVEANPRNGGYLLSRAERFEDLRKKVTKGEILGEIFDPFSFKEVEQLRSPEDGYLIFSRVSGPVEAGEKGFAVAKKIGSMWVANGYL
ncbi:MAG: succinylglutamate desuccinylase/aspartoacylase family protein [Deltaproteobacteria bacterium]|nr:succinylglutamate desuccinylase/aspartoacylase family protein [Deltaproteobacteria bacterium]MBW2309120.1 succinylglutamate desuccinylase/aspartoacylase family protein [Deltaproteobacteria bacterium]